MKENSKANKTSVCKEDVLMCVFKGVPDYVGEEEELELSGSHYEVVVGRAGAPSSFSLHSPESERMTHKKRKKEKVSLTADESQVEIEIWSSPYTSKEALPTPMKEEQLKMPKKKKTKKWNMNEQTLCRFAERLVRDTSSAELTSDEPLYEKYPDADALCDECCWLVRASWSSTRHVDDLQENDEELERLMRKLKADNSTEFSYVKNYKKGQVSKLLDEVRSSLLECSILLTVSRLRAKINREREWKGDEEKENKSESELDGTPSEMEMLIDEIKEEEDVKEGQSKLCLALGRFVSKYLKVT